MNREIQIILEKYALMPTYQHLIEAVESIQQFQAYPNEIISALYQQDWRQLYRLRRDLESENGFIILRHLYTYLQQFSSAPADWSLVPNVPSILVMRNSILRSLCRAGDVEFVLWELQKFYQVFNLSGGKDMETELCQGIYNLAEIPQSPPQEVYLFLHDVLRSPEIQMIHAAAHALSIIGVDSDLPIMRARLENSQELSGAPISMIDAMIAIGGNVAADQLLHLLEECNQVFEGINDLPINLIILPYLIRDIALLLGPFGLATQVVDMNRIDRFRNLIAETSRINRTHSIWVQVNSQTNEEIQRVQRWLIDPIFPYQSNDHGHSEYDNFRRRKFSYRGSASIYNVKDVLILATNKIGWSAPQPDENLQAWCNRVLVEMRLDYMIPGSPAWEDAYLRLQNIIHLAQVRDVFNCCQELYYLSISPANPEDENEDED